MLRHLPNLLTISRIVLLPVLIALFFIPESWAAWTALGVYIFCAVTDFFDGYLARRLNVTSGFGTFMDPISDKILVASLLLTLAAFGRLEGVWIVPAIVILAREFLIAGLREYLGPRDIKVPVSNLAKWKTGVQMTALGFLVIGDYGNAVLPHTLLIGQAGLTVAAVITLASGWSYMRAGFRHI